jgi:hypothetical protein
MRLKALIGVLVLALTLPAQAELIRPQRVYVVDTLTVTGTSTFLSSLLIPDGSVTVPAIGFASDNDGTGTGIYRSGTSAMAFVNNNSIAFRTTTTGINLGSGIDIILSRAGASGMRVSGGTAPTGTGCGTGAAYAGNSTNGKVTVGTTPGTCAITFSGTQSSAPNCYLNNQTSAQLARATSVTTAGFTISGTIAAGDVISYWCPVP